MNTIVDVAAVTAVRIRDGWRDVTEFQFYGDPQHPAGASWRENNGCRYTCPMMCLLTVREGTPVDADAPEPESQPDPPLQAAVRWLESALQDGPREAQVLIQRARDQENIRRSLLYRAAKYLHVDTTLRRLGQSVWQLAPLNEGEEMLVAE